MPDFYDTYIKSLSLFNVLIDTINHIGLQANLNEMQARITEKVKIIDLILMNSQAQPNGNIKQATIKIMLNNIETINSYILESSQYIKENNIHDEAKENARIILAEFSEFFHQIRENELNKLREKQQVTGSMATLLQDATNQDTENLTQTLKNIANYFKHHGYRTKSCFISCAWPNKNDLENVAIEKDMQEFLKTLRRHLRAAGIIAYLDIEDKHEYESVYQYAEKIQESSYILLIGTESLLKEHKEGLSHVTDQLVKIKRKRMEDKLSYQHTSVFPILLSGSVETSFPENFECYAGVADWRGAPYQNSLKDLVRLHYNETKDNISYERLWNTLSNEASSNVKKIVTLTNHGKKNSNASIKMPLENSMGIITLAEKACYVSCKDVSRDGDCFFHAVNHPGLTRAALVEKLLQIKGEKKHRSAIASEIMSFLQIGYCSEGSHAFIGHIREHEQKAAEAILALPEASELKKLFEERNKLDEKKRELQVYARELLGEDFSKGKIYDELLTLVNEGGFSEHTQAMELHRRQEEKLECAIKKQCGRRVLYRAYVEMYLDKACGYIPFHRDFDGKADSPLIEQIKKLWGIDITIWVKDPWRPLKPVGETHLIGYHIFYSNSHFQQLHLQELTPQASISSLCFPTEKVPYASCANLVTYCKFLQMLGSEQQSEAKRILDNLPGLVQGIVLDENNIKDVLLLLKLGHRTVSLTLIQKIYDGLQDALETPYLCEALASALSYLTVTQPKLLSHETLLKLLQAVVKLATKHQLDLGNAANVVVESSTNSLSQIIGLLLYYPGIGETLYKELKTCLKTICLNLKGKKAIQVQFAGTYYKAQYGRKQLEKVQKQQTPKDKHDHKVKGIKAVGRVGVSLAKGTVSAATGTGLLAIAIAASVATDGALAVVLIPPAAVAFGAGWYHFAKKSKNAVVHGLRAYHHLKSPKTAKTALFLNNDGFAPKPSDANWKVLFAELRTAYSVKEVKSADAIALVNYLAELLEWYKAPEQVVKEVVEYCQQFYQTFVADKIVQYHVVKCYLRLSMAGYQCFPRVTSIEEATSDKTFAAYQQLLIPLASELEPYFLSYKQYKIIPDSDEENRILKKNQREELKETLKKGGEAVSWEALKKAYKDQVVLRAYLAQAVQSSPVEVSQKNGSTLSCAKWWFSHDMFNYDKQFRKCWDRYQGLEGRQQSKNVEQNDSTLTQLANQFNFDVYPHLNNPSTSSWARQRGIYLEYLLRGDTGNTLSDSVNCSEEGNNKLSISLQPDIYDETASVTDGTTYDENFTSDIKIEELEKEFSVQKMVPPISNKNIGEQSPMVIKEKKDKYTHFTDTDRSFGDFAQPSKKEKLTPEEQVSVLKKSLPATPSQLPENQAQDVNDLQRRFDKLRNN